MIESTKAILCGVKEAKADSEKRCDELTVITQNLHNDLKKASSLR